MFSIGTDSSNFSGSIAGLRRSSNNIVSVTGTGAKVFGLTTAPARAASPSTTTWPAPPGPTRRSPTAGRPPTPATFAAWTGYQQHGSEQLARLRRCQRTRLPPRRAHRRPSTPASGCPVSATPGPAPLPTWAATSGNRRTGGAPARVARGTFASGATRIAQTSWTIWYCHGWIWPRSGRDPDLSGALGHSEAQTRCDDPERRIAEASTPAIPLSDGDDPATLPGGDGVPR